jgi:UDP-N-acetylmuramate dehydrogenase
MSQSAVAYNTNVVDGVVRTLQSELSAAIRRGVLGSDLCTFGIGGAVDALVTVNSLKELCVVRQVVGQSAVPARILGNGSNVLISDAGVPGFVVKLSGDLRRVSNVGEGAFDVGGAVSLMSLARKLSTEGFSGLEFAAGIPATCGGALFMNAGAHGAELGERVVFVEGVTPNGEVVRFSREELPWRYRSSGLASEFFITSARLKLVPGDREKISTALAHNLAERRMRQPLTLPSAGSVFKNPSPELATGRLLEQAGLKGARVGGAVLSELHANWIVNPERMATASDVCQLVTLCQAKAQEFGGVELHPEIRMWL